MTAAPADSLSRIHAELKVNSHTWLITGVAGFIGANLLEALLRLDQRVVGLDSFATGHRANLDDVKDAVGPERWARFQFHEGDIRNLETCRRCCEGVEILLHQAALGSVPRSLKDPVTTNAVNIDGFLNMIVAARDAGVKRTVYAASSSTYGDHPGLPKVEHLIGNPLSPYAVTKYVNELYARVFAQSYGFKAIGLRYFNVFGRRQDPNGAYAAVIPRWIRELLSGSEVLIYGDGETSRDFCYIDNVIQANLLAAFASEDATGEVYNVAYGGRTTLNELFELIRAGLEKVDPKLRGRKPSYQDFRKADVRHSLADITKARTMLGYTPEWSAKRGLEAALDWYVASLAKG